MINIFLAHSPISQLHMFCLGGRGEGDGGRDLKKVVLTTSLIVYLSIYLYVEKSDHTMSIHHSKFIVFTWTLL